MKLAALGVIAGVMGLVAGEDGLLLTAALWIPGGLLLRTVHGPPGRETPEATWRGAFGGRRGLAIVIVVAVGAASVVIGVVPVLFDGDEGWRWIPVVVGGFGAGVQLVAFVLFAFGSGLERVGSGLETLVGAQGDPDHPATVRLDSVRETGTRINDRPRMELTVMVTPQGRPAYTVTLKKVIGFAELGALRVGTTYRGRVDLEVPEGVSIDWHAPIDAGVAGAVAADDVSARLDRVDRLLRDGAISAEEHASARRDILGDL